MEGALTKLTVGDLLVRSKVIQFGSKQCLNEALLVIEDLRGFSSKHASIRQLLTRTPDHWVNASWSIL